MAQQKRILITGGLGLIGHNVVLRLQHGGHDCTVYDNKTTYGIIPQAEIDYLMAERLKRLSPLTKVYQQDLGDHAALAWLMETQEFDTVVHMASFPRQKVVNANPPAASRVMSESLLDLLELSVAHGVKKFVYISSSMVYGSFSDDVQEDAECRPEGQYGIMKLAGEWLVRDYTRRTGMHHAIIRPSAVYGPLDVEDRVISRFLLTAMCDGTLQVNGATETLDLTYVDDAANGIVAAVLRDEANDQTFNITKSHSWTLLEAAELAVRIAGRGHIEVRDRDADFPSRGSLNIDRARHILNYNPQVDIDRGFQIYHDWLKNSIYWSPKTVS